MSKIRDEKSPCSTSLQCCKSTGLVLRLYTASPHGPPDPTFGLQMEVVDDLPMVVEEEVLGGGEEIEQEKKFTGPRFVQDELKMSKRLLIAVLVDKRLQNLQELAINMTLTKFVPPRKNPEKQIP